MFYARAGVGVQVVVRVSELYARPGAGGVRVSASYARPRVSYTGILLFWGVSVVCPGVCSYDLLMMRKKDDTLLYLSPVSFR